MKYFIDSNCLITAKNDFYSFDVAPKFWDELKKHIDSGEILIHQAVFEELTRQNDDLSDWIKGLNLKRRINISDSQTMINYGRVIDHISTCGYYQPQAVSNWSQASVADPQLIASSMTHGFTIVTLEKINRGRNQTNKSKNAKIPDVAKDLGVRTVTLLQMMRELHITL